MTDQTPNLAPTAPPTTPAGWLSGLLLLTRPKQWTKNLLVFAGIIFTRKLFDLHLFGRASLAFAAFCACAGMVYTLNDLQDIERDRLHPDKRRRPLASGRVGVARARLCAALLACIGAALAALLGWEFALWLGCYVLLNLAYTYALKNVVILDILAIASGFLLRALAGIAVVRAVEKEVEITPWFLGCSFFLALLLVIGKRRHETVSLGDERAAHRPVLEHYSPLLLDQLLAISTTLTIGSYSLWTALGRFADRQAVLTVPFVVYGVFRYLYLVYQRQAGGAPERLLGDGALLLNVLLWFVTVVVLLNL